jgi:ubiquinone/menaquinone biosynthesis C-methylase UbiE
MDNGEPIPFLLSIDERAQEQYEQSYSNVHARRRLYNYARPPINLSPEFKRGIGLHQSLDFHSSEERELLEVVFKEIDDEIIDIERKLAQMLDLKGTERVLDVGCSDGAFLRYLALGQGHKGEMVGIDKFNHAAFNQRIALGGRYVPIEFFTNDAAEQIWFPSDSIDVITNKFVVYHAERWEHMLDEMLRVVRPGGKVALATRGIENMNSVWEDTDEMADEMAKDEGVPKNERIEAFYHDAPPEEVIAEFEKRFEMIDYFEQSSKTNGSYLSLKGVQGWWDLYSSFFSIKDFKKYAKNPDDIEGLFMKLDKLVHEKVRPKYEDEINRRGEYRLEVEQYILIGTPKK